MADRAEIIAENLAPFFAANQTVLEIGAGKGLVARALQEQTGARLTLVDVVDYNQTDLPVRTYDGRHLPFPDASFDYALLAFVLHHTPDPVPVLDEAQRVSRRGVIIAENNVQGWLRKHVTRIVDSIPHFQHGVPVCHHVLQIDEWLELFHRLPGRATLLARFSLGPFWDNFVLLIEPPLPSAAGAPDLANRG